MKKIINTIENDKRTSTQNLMQEIWNAIDEGCTDFEINACGQHNIGGSVWSKDGNDFGKCNGCNTGKCPIGITTQNPKLMQRLDVDRVAENIVNYICATDIELKKLLAPVGNSTLPIGRSDALVCVDRHVANRLNIQYVC